MSRRLFFCEPTLIRRLFDVLEEAKPDVIVEVMPCLNCDKADSVDCGFHVRDYWGEFNCEAPDEDLDECPCYHTWCQKCKEGDNEES